MKKRSMGFASIEMFPRGRNSTFSTSGHVVRLLLRLLLYGVISSPDRLFFSETYL